MGVNDYRAHAWNIVANVIVPVLLLVLLPLLGCFWVVDHNTKAGLHANQVASCERGNALRALAKIIVLSQLADLKAASDHDSDPEVRREERRNYIDLQDALADPTNAPLLAQQPCH